MQNLAVQLMSAVLAAGYIYLMHAISKVDLEYFSQAHRIPVDVQDLYHRNVMAV